jgi:hypothetical protein
MNDIHRVLGRAAWRLGVINFLRAWVMALGALIAAAIILRILEQLLGFTSTAATRIGPAPVGPALPGAHQPIDSTFMWERTAYFGLGATVVIAAAWAIIVRPKPLTVARRVDEGANLRESLSTAICIARQTDPWSRATIESASRTARGVNINQAVPITPPRFWPVVLALGLSFAVVFLAFPKLDVMGWFSQAVAQKKTEVEIINAKREVKEIEKKIEELTAKIPSLEKEKALETPPADKPEPKTAEEIRKAMVASLSKKAEQLEDLKGGVKAQKLEVMQAQLKQLKQPGQETSDLAKSLAKGDFKAAKAELEKVKDKLAADSKMSEADKQKLAEQLENLAKQMQQMAENKAGMEKALEQAGIPKEALASKEELRKALEKSENLTKEQKEALQKMAEGGMECKQGMAAMAEAMSQMSKSGKEQSGEGSQGSESMSKQLSDMESLQQEMQMADAAMSECKSALQSLGKDGDSKGMGECSGGQCNGSQPGSEGTKPWSAGWSQSQGNGRGGPGLGQGGRPGEARADFDLEKKKWIGDKGDGPIVSSKLVEGESIKGESRAAFAKAVASADQGATEAIENNVIPREYHDAIKSYFGRLKSKAAANPAGASDKKDTPPAEAAPDADKK